MNGIVCVYVCACYEVHVCSAHLQVNAVFAADAVARLTGVIGVAVVTAGPGLCLGFVKPTTGGIM